MISTVKIITALVAICLLVPFISVHADEMSEKSAVAASRAWLALVDSGRYAESWDESAQLFKAAITREKWGNTIKSVREPFGKTLSRKLGSKTYTETLPGAPDGKYVVIQYMTSFEHKKSAIETITPMLDKDGYWRVSGYYIK
jgi:hypothetical protein